ncbi:MAG: phosphatase PAP2 family protein [Flavobacterium sp.]
MKTKLTFLLILTTLFAGNAQTIDSVSTPKKQDKLSYKQFIAPAALIASGTLLLNSELNLKIQENANEFFGEDFHTSADNYIPFVPLVQMYGGKYLGFKPKNDFFHQTANFAIATGIMGTVVQTLKYTVKEERPDGSNNLSFPSAHTATAFTNASLLFYEFKDSNLWYAGSGFLFASATGILRIANNKHYTSDVLAGAGIGLASGLIVSYWNPLKNYSFKGKNKKTTSFLYPTLGKQMGLGMLIQLH